jgi:integrase
MVYDPLDFTCGILTGAVAFKPFNDAAALFTNSGMSLRICRQLLKHGELLLNRLGVVSSGCSDRLSCRWSAINPFVMQSSRTVARFSLALLTKNKEGRLIFFPDELNEVIRDQRAKTSDLERIQGRIIPWVFHRDREQIKDFREAWNYAGRRAGCTGRYFHDLRRTGIRNMIRRGISEPVAMKVSGHKTADVFWRYNIVVEDDLRNVGRRMSGIVSGIVEPNQGKFGERR